jgi:hypothetical protein
MSDYVPVLGRRVLTRRDPALVQLSFRAEVLDRYRGQAGYSIIRTDTAGRLRKQGGWSLDFGIAPGDARIHASWQALATNLPDGELEHWGLHLAGEYSDNFLRMQLAPGSCFDDGELRSW